MHYRTWRKLTPLAAGTIVFQWTACLGPDPAGFVEDSVWGALFSNLFSILFNTLLSGAAA